MSSISAAIVSYNTREHLRACLASVVADHPRDVVVVDNGSSDGSTEMVRSEFPTVTLRVTTENRGYGAAANQALDLTSGSYTLLLNSDTILAPGTLQALAKYLDQHPRAGIAGPRLVTPDRRLQRSCYPPPTPLHVFVEESSLGKCLRFAPVVGRRYERTWEHDRPRVVSWVLGAALAIRREAFTAVGGFDESFFMYYEEVDLSHRLAHAGWQTHFAPVAAVTHIGGASTRNAPAEMRLQWYISILRFYQCHYSPLRSLELIAVINGIVALRLARDTLRARFTYGAARADLEANLTAWRRILKHKWWLASSQ